MAVRNKSLIFPLIDKDTLSSFKVGPRDQWHS